MRTPRWSRDELGHAATRAVVTTSVAAGLSFALTADATAVAFFALVGMGVGPLALAERFLSRNTRAGRARQMLRLSAILTACAGAWCVLAILQVAYASGIWETWQFSGGVERAGRVLWVVLDVEGVRPFAKPSFAPLLWPLLWCGAVALATATAVWPAGSTPQLQEFGWLSASSILIVFTALFVQKVLPFLVLDFGPSPSAPVFGPLHALLISVGGAFVVVGAGLVLSLGLLVLFAATWFLLRRLQFPNPRADRET